MAMAAGEVEDLLETQGSELDLGDTVTQACRQVVNLYDRQYGESSWYEPGRVAAHESMRGVWTGEEEEEGEEIGMLAS